MGAGRGCPRGSRPRLPASHLGARAALPGTGCVSAGPAISDRAGGPWPGRKVQAARVNFAQSIGGVFIPPALVRGASRQRIVKDFPGVRGACSLRMAECVGERRGLRLKGCRVNLWWLLSDRLRVSCVSHEPLAFCLPAVQPYSCFKGNGKCQHVHVTKLRKRKGILSPLTFSSSISFEEAAKASSCELTDKLRWSVFKPYWNFCWGW